jgi:hypothetical protein
MNSTRNFWSLAVLWFATVGSGLLGLTVYSIVPGEPALPGVDWPADSGIPFHCGRPNLIVFLHPRCPCSRATLAELERVIASTEQCAAVSIVLIQPERIHEGWERAAAWLHAHAIPGARVFTDHGGVLTRRFGAATSGQVLLYASGGRLVFQGGITGSRGHEGDNAGRAAVIAAINGAGNTDTSTPVFGCELSSDRAKLSTRSLDYRSVGSREKP